MGRVVIDSRGVIEESKGDGVVIDIRTVGRVVVDGLMVCKGEPATDSVPDGLVALWREDGSIKGKTSDGEPVELCCPQEVKPAPKPAPAPVAAPKRKSGKGRAKAKDSDA